MSLLSFTKKIRSKKEVLISDKSVNKKIEEKSNVSEVKKISSDEKERTDFGIEREFELRQLITEKSVRMHEDSVATFRVPKWAINRQIKKAVRIKYGVKVINVRTVTMLPKRRRRGATTGFTNYWKKAYVKVDNIQSLNIGP